ncbi:hypothetical protein [Novosphingobium sp.]|uniref:hypothetical protein n=1 Tax=Novosphingobium sp. TaxID=1874826 RepID=UPI00286DFDE8|nr:hypothetical protein [Novosphingobium sp.]
MAILATDNLIIDRGGTHYKAPVSALPSGGGSGLGGLATITIPTAQLEWEETVTATGVTPASRIMACLAPALDADENDPALLSVVNLSASPGTDQITISIAFAVPAQGAIKLNWSAM